VSGSAVLRAQAQEVTNALKGARSYTVNGTPILAVNMHAARYMSEAVGKLAETSPSGIAAAWFQLSSGDFVWSLRSVEGSDAGTLAASMGGGGTYERLSSRSAWRSTSACWRRAGSGSRRLSPWPASVLPRRWSWWSGASRGPCAASRSSGQSP